MGEQKVREGGGGVELGERGDDDGWNRSGRRRMEKKKEKEVGMDENGEKGSKRWTVGRGVKEKEEEERLEKKEVVREERGENTLGRNNKGLRKSNFTDRSM